MGVRRTVPEVRVYAGMESAVAAAHAKLKNTLLWRTTMALVGRFLGGRKKNLV